MLCLAVYVHFLTVKGTETEAIFTHNLAGWHIAAYKLVEGMKVNVIDFAEIEHTHTATNVNAHDVGDDLVTKIACEANYAARSGMDVGHDANLLVGKHVNGEQFIDLLQCVFFNVVREYLHVISFNCLHILIIFAKI